MVKIAMGVDSLLLLHTVKHKRFRDWRLVMIGIKDVVLNHKENVEEHTDTSQTQFHNITLQSRPFIYRSHVPPNSTENRAIHKELNDGQGTTREI